MKKNYWSITNTPINKRFSNLRTIFILSLTGRTTASGKRQILYTSVCLLCMPADMARENNSSIPA